MPLSISLCVVQKQEPAPKPNCHLVATIVSNNLHCTVRVFFVLFVFFWCWFIQKPVIDICIRFDSHNLSSLTQSPIIPTLAVDYSYPCWTKQGGEVMQEKTENQIDKNYFVWDTAYYRWKCAATSTSCSNLVLGIVVTTVLQQLWNLM